MLKGIPEIIAPELMSAMMNMGHGDEILLADGNFPAASNARKLIRCDGCTVAQLLKAIMFFLPLDHTVEKPAAVMSIRDDEEIPAAWHAYRDIIEQEADGFGGFEQIERFAFYDRAKSAYAIVITSDKAYKGNLILKKGSVR